jgi:hypothetical protein
MKRPKAPLSLDQLTIENNRVILRSDDSAENFNAAIWQLMGLLRAGYVFDEVLIRRYIPRREYEEWVAGGNQRSTSGDRDPTFVGVL